MTRQRDLAYVLDIINAAKLAKSFIGNLTKEKFYEDLKTQSAVIRQLEIIGEATKKVSEEFRNKHNGIEWKKMAGMRDILIHDYHDVDLDEVWNAIKIS